MAHKHKCPNVACSHVWQHEPPAADCSKEEFWQMHSCPQCGAQQTHKHYESVEDEIADFKDQMNTFFGIPLR